MNVVFVALLGLLAPAIMVAAEEICHPPQSTTICYMAMNTKGLWYSISDFENGFAYWLPADSMNQDSFIVLDLNSHVTYTKLKGEQCTFRDTRPSEQERVAQCIPDHAYYFGEVDGRPIYRADYEDGAWFTAYTKEEGTPYYHRYVVYYEEDGQLVDFGYALFHMVGITDPSILQLDLSACVAA
ncbi:hypothetical protein ElyMa_004339500 [Elysia marginata]|uniref:Lipocalin/cytosolic fatty-acid binding domain-containing protein n=1 Tax=Elysia marginata TaxID=1093978 RepID=A0AAV4H341_9GAST|nr:hypothetical protein ElyMa_004339500 [Elysia marginata]